MFTVMQSVSKRMAGANDALTNEDEVPKHKFSIVNTASVAALRGTPAMIAYSSSKAAVIAMTVSAAKGMFYNILDAQSIALLQYQVCILGSHLHPL